MLQSDAGQRVYVRTDTLVAPVALLLWPGATYDVPFFVGMQTWAAGAARDTVVVARAAAADGAPPPAVRVNGADVAGPWGASVLCDVTQRVLPGRNVLSLRNALSETSVSVEVCVEVRQGVEASTFIRGIPQDANEICLDALSLWGAADDGVAAVRVAPSALCPISRTPIAQAVRGRACRHAQAYDAAAYVALCAMSGRWECPVCGDAVLPEDLVCVRR